jgi:hypothetical protein
VLDADDLNHLIQEVRDLIEYEGFLPLGGIAVDNGHFYRGVIKHLKED